MTDENFGFSAGTMAVGDDPQIQTADDGGFFDEPDFGSGGGGFPPRILPGPVLFRFEATDLRSNVSPKSVQSLANGEVPTLIYTAHIQLEHLATDRRLRDAQPGEMEWAVRFNEASAFKSETMKNYIDPKTNEKRPIPSDLEILFSALNLKEEYGRPGSLDDMVRIMQNCGTVYARGTLIWRVNQKLSDGSYVNYATLKERKDTRAWPEAVDGILPTEVLISDGDTKITKLAQERVVKPRPATR